MPKTILIVDDINVNRHILRHMLAREYNVLEAENGEDALALLARGRNRPFPQCCSTFICRAWTAMRFCAGCVKIQIGCRFPW